MMKKIISLIFLLSIVIQPIANVSLVAYYSLNIDEIIDKYCINKDKPALNCNGKCYLSQQLNAVDNSSEDNDKINITESFVLVYLNKTEDCCFESLNKHVKKYSISHYTQNYKAISADVITPPPKYI